MSVQQTIEQKIQLEFQPHFFTVEEWSELNKKIPASTKCAGVGH